MPPLTNNLKLKMCKFLNLKICLTVIGLINAIAAQIQDANSTKSSGTYSFESTGQYGDKGASLTVSSSEMFIHSILSQTNNSNKRRPVVGSGASTAGNRYPKNSSSKQLSASYPNIALTKESLNQSESTTIPPSITNNETLPQFHSLVSKNNSSNETMGPGAIPTLQSKAELNQNDPIQRITPQNLTPQSKLTALKPTADSTANGPFSENPRADLPTIKKDGGRFDYFADHSSEVANNDVETNSFYDKFKFLLQRVSSTTESNTFDDYGAVEETQSTEDSASEDEDLNEYHYDYEGQMEEQTSADDILPGQHSSTASTDYYDELLKAEISTGSSTTIEQTALFDEYDDPSIVTSTESSTTEHFDDYDHLLDPPITPLSTKEKSNITAFDEYDDADTKVSTSTLSSIGHHSMSTQSSGSNSSTTGSFELKKPNDTNNIFDDYDDVIAVLDMAVSTSTASMDHSSTTERFGDYDQPITQLPSDKSPLKKPNVTNIIDDYDDVIAVLDMAVSTSTPSPTAHNSSDSFDDYDEFLNLLVSFTEGSDQKPLKDHSAVNEIGLVRPAVTDSNKSPPTESHHSRPESFDEYDDGHINHQTAVIDPPISNLNDQFKGNQTPIIVTYNVTFNAEVGPPKDKHSLLQSNNFVHSNHANETIKEPAHHGASSSFSTPSDMVLDSSGYSQQNNRTKVKWPTATTPKWAIHTPIEKPPDVSGNEALTSDSVLLQSVVQSKPVTATKAVNCTPAANEAADKKVIITTAAPTTASPPAPFVTNIVQIPAMQPFGGMANPGLLPINALNAMNNPALFLNQMRPQMPMNLLNNPLSMLSNPFRGQVPSMPFGNAGAVLPNQLAGNPFIRNMLPSRNGFGAGGLPAGLSLNGLLSSNGQVKVISLPGGQPTQSTTTQPPSTSASPVRTQEGKPCPEEPSLSVTTERQLSAASSLLSSYPKTVHGTSGRADEVDDPPTDSRTARPNAMDSSFLSKRVLEDAESPPSPLNDEIQSKQSVEAPASENKDAQVKPAPLMLPSPFLLMMSSLAIPAAIGIASLSRSSIGRQDMSPFTQTFMGFAAAIVPTFLMMLFVNLPRAGRRSFQNPTPDVVDVLSHIIRIIDTFPYKDQ